MTRVDPRIVRINIFLMVGSHKAIYFNKVGLQIFSSNFVVEGQNKNKWPETNYFLFLKSQKVDVGFDQKNK